VNYKANYGIAMLLAMIGLVDNVSHDGWTFVGFVFTTAAFLGGCITWMRRHAKKS